MKDTFKQAVREAVENGGHARWGEAESLSVCKAVIAKAAGESGLDEIEAQALANNAATYIQKVINPSAFAQILEKLPEGHASRIVRPKRGTGGSRAALDL